jgi:tetratricopeptide (TPR) repeat protein
MIFAREAANPEERTAAFEKAAELSLAAGDELGALFVCREAARSGADEGLGALAHTARLRLGLDEEEPPTTIEERLALAESSLAKGERARAAELFEGLYLARGALAEPDQARVLAGWSAVLLDRVGLEAALEVLAKARASFEDPLAARTLDLAAASLLESEGRFDEAAEAYRGVY